MADDDYDALMRITGCLPYGITLTKTDTGHTMNVIKTDPKTTADQE
jgi:hypothetical protein